MNPITRMVRRNLRHKQGLVLLTPFAAFFAGISTIYFGRFDLGVGLSMVLTFIAFSINAVDGDMFGGVILALATVFGQILANLTMVYPYWVTALVVVGIIFYTTLSRAVRRLEVEQRSRFK